MVLAFAPASAIALERPDDDGRAEAAGLDAAQIDAAAAFISTSADGGLRFDSEGAISAGVDPTVVDATVEILADLDEMGLNEELAGSAGDLSTASVGPDFACLRSTLTTIAGQLGIGTAATYAMIAAATVAGITPLGVVSIVGVAAAGGVTAANGYLGVIEDCF